MSEAEAPYAGAPIHHGIGGIAAQVVAGVHGSMVLEPSVLAPRAQRPKSEGDSA